MYRLLSWFGLALLPVQEVQADVYVFDYGLSHWTYREPEIAVRHEGWLPMLALQWQPAQANEASGRWRVSAALAGGVSEYTGSGTMGGQPVLSTRLSLAYDIPLTDTGWTWAPVLAFDRLDNDARGVTSTGARGYRRINQRWSAGLELMSQPGTEWQLKFGLNSMLRGWQRSVLGDIGQEFAALVPTVNVQRQGWGGLLGACRVWEDRRFCAQWQHWHIQRSDALRVQTLNVGYTVYEPANRSSLLSVTLQHHFD